jgi:uncharacterized coiled-coil protein SlyX
MTESKLSAELEEMRRIIVEQGRTIEELSRLVAELLAEVKRLRMRTGRAA